MQEPHAIRNRLMSIFLVCLILAGSIAVLAGAMYAWTYVLAAVNIEIVLK